MGRTDLFSQVLFSGSFFPGFCFAELRIASIRTMIRCTSHFLLNMFFSEIFRPQGHFFMQGAVEK
jgi:hypothetical protein